MLDDILNPRRAPRVPLRCEVEIRHRLSVWNGETEDISPGGCQIVTPRVVDPGRDVKLAIRCDALSRTLLLAGRVVWTRVNAPTRLGVSFTSEALEPGWFDALVKASAVALHAVRTVPDRLARPTRVYLGPPPERVVDFTSAELDVLRRIGAGVTLDALARSYAPSMSDRTRGALFALIARRRVVFDRSAAVSPDAWREIFPEREASDAPLESGETERAIASGRSLEAQRLYDEALAHIGSGRLAIAMDRLRDALRHAPNDPMIASTAKRIGRWA